ncbi:MAG: hypothetical protein ABL931_22475, partial [Usitatibacteraceae bacterium]
MIRIFNHHFHLGTLLLAALNVACVSFLVVFGLYVAYPTTGQAMLHPVAEAIAIGLAAAVFLARFSFTHASSSIINRRVLVLGVGRDAAMVKEALD